MVARTEGLQVKYLPRPKLKPYAKNARKHSTAQINAVAKSIEKFGWTVPILVDRNLEVIAGHARLAAAEVLEVKEVPVIMLDDLTPAQKRAYTIADNKLTLGASWDDEILKEELLTLEREDFDLGSMGFTDDELASALDRIQLDPDGGLDPETKPPVCRPGDVWLLGTHVLTVGDTDLKAADQTIESWQGYTDEEAHLGEDAGPIFKNVRKARKSGG